jgi:hypothetical protein
MLHDLHYARLFARTLAAAGLAAHVDGAHLSSGRCPVLRVSVSLPDEWEWGLRYDVLKGAGDFQAEYGVPVVCDFRPAANLEAIA